jgi:hypothetical protein
MSEIIKNKTLQYLLAGVCGVIVGVLFLSLYGVVFGYLADIQAIGWIKILPQRMQRNAYWVHTFFFESLILAFLTIFLGGLVGTILKIDRFKASTVAFSAFLLTKIFYHFLVFNQFSVSDSPITYFVAISLMSWFLFWFSFSLSGRITRKRR